MARLLVVDDEAALLALLGRYLERCGHAVKACTTADAALAEFLAAPTAFDLVVTDLTLDGMSGEEMLGKMRQKNPKIPAVIASGYPYEPHLKGVQFLQKPFLPQMLVDMI
ncbi:MAG: response regulator, partial [Acidobacteriota bacterium]